MENSPSKATTPQIKNPPSGKTPFFLSEFQNKKLVLAIISIIGFFLMFILAFTPNLDPDLGWHLKTGELMWEYKTIPHTDWYSYTMPSFPGSITSG